MGTFNAAEIQALLYEEVDPEVREAFEQATVFINRLKKGKPKFTNSRGCRISTRVRRNPAIAWYTGGGVYPVGGTPRYIDMRVFYANYVIAGAITKEALDLGNRNAMLDVLSTRIKDDTQTLLKELEQQCWENGDGTKGVVSSAVTGAAGTITFTTPFGARRIFEGGIYNAYAPDGTPRVAGTTDMVLASKVESTGVGTFDSVATDILAGDVVTWKGSFNRAIHGIPYHVNNDSGFYQGQSRGTYPQLKATVFDANSAAISVSIVDRTIALNKYRIGTDKNWKNNFTIWTSPCQYQSYKQLGYSLIRFSGPGSTMDGTFKDIAHAGLDWEEIVDLPDDELYGLRMESINWYELDAMSILKEDSLTLRYVPAFSSAGAGSFKSELVYYIGGSGDIGCGDPRWNFKIDNLSTTNLPTGMAA